MEVTVREDGSYRVQDADPSLGEDDILQLIVNNFGLRILKTLEAGGSFNMSHEGNDWKLTPIKSGQGED